jgi:hypothetical protein
MFRDRKTGRIVIAQRPNPALLVFLVASVIQRFGHPHGRVRSVIGAVAVIALLWWAVDEMVRGVNPFRRLLGVVIGVITVAGNFF